MSTDRPKRNIIKKKYDDSEGMPWCEERVVRKVLFLSLREFRSGQMGLNNTTAARGGSTAKRHSRRSASKGGVTVNGRTDHSQRSSQKQHGGRMDHSQRSSQKQHGGRMDHSQRSSQKQHGGRETSEEDNSDRKRPRLQAQRKFAQSQPSSPSSTPLKTSPPDPVTDAPSNHRPPKTEDFLSYLCLRGTVALPGNMAYLGSVQDDADLQDDEEEEAGPEGGTAVNQDLASCSATNRRRRLQGRRKSNVFPSHSRCLRGRSLGMTRRPGEAIQGAERRERRPTTTTMDPTGASARASAPNHLRYRYPRVPQQLPLASMATGLSGISSSTRRTFSTKRTPPLRLLPPRAARSSASPVGPVAPPPRSPATPPRSQAPPPRSPAAPPRSPASPPSRSLARPNRTSGLHSRSATSRSKTRRVRKTKLTFRRRRSNSHRPKPHSRRPNHRFPRRPKSDLRPTSRSSSRHHPAHSNSGKIPECTAKPSKPAATAHSQAAGRQQQSGEPRSPEAKLRSVEGLRQSRRRRGLPAETDSAPEVMEVRLQVSGPQTRSRTLGHGGKVGRVAVVTSRHVRRVPSKPSLGQRQAQRPEGDVSTLTRQAQSSQG